MEALRQFAFTLSMYSSPTMSFFIHEVHMYLLFIHGHPQIAVQHVARFYTSVHLHYTIQYRLSILILLLMTCITSLTVSPLPALRMPCTCIICTRGTVIALFYSVHVFVCLSVNSSVLYKNQSGNETLLKISTINSFYAA